MNRLITGVLCLLLLAPAFAAKKHVMTLKETVTTQYVGTSKVSPDGSKTAYTLVIPREPYQSDDGGHYVELHITDNNGKSRPYITGEVNVSSITWSHNNQYVYYLAKRNDDKFKSLYRIPVDGGESQKVFEHTNNIASFSLNHTGESLLYIAKPKKDKHEKKLKKKGFKAEVYEEDAEFSRVYRVDLTKDKKTSEVLKNIDENVLSIEHHPSRDLFLARVTPTPHIDDNYTRSQYKVFKTNGVATQSFKTEGKLGAAHWSPDGQYVAIIGAENKNDPAAGRLFVANSRTGKLDEVLKNYQGHVKDIAWTSDYQLTYLGHIGTSSEVAIINLDSGKVENLLPLGQAALSSFDVDSNGSNMVATMGTPQHPREVYSVSEGKLKRLTNSNSWLEDIKMPKQVSMTYQARDGLSLDGIFVYPVNYKKGKRYPLIMMVHGGPESHISNEWLDRYSYPIKHATGNGFAVFLPNYRGSTGKGVEFSKKGQADYAGAEFNDLVDAITHLSNEGLIDKERVGITGGSYGGYASAWAATALSEHFAASVMFVGISNQLSKFGTTDIPVEMYNVHARNYPWDKWQWMLERSPIYHTGKAKTPILIMHGKNDTRVHPAQSMELYRYIKTRTETPVRLVYYPGEGHGNRRAAAQLDYAQRLMRWMNFYLKGKKKGNKIPPFELDHAKQLEDDKEDK